MANSAPAPSALDREFLEIRARVLELAAALDRLDRAGESGVADPRLARIAEGIQALESSQSDRAERVQLIFSLPYDQEWRTNLGVLSR